MKSNRPLHKIGFSQTAGNIWFEDNDYANHWHIPGTTREGKSKFIEVTIDPLIGESAIVLIDPSDNGATYKAVLNHCAYRGYEKVCLIDPNEFHQFIPSINPLRWRGEGAAEAVIDECIDSLRVLWGQASFDATPRIEYYLAHVLHTLYQNKLPLSKAIYFTVKQNRMVEAGRNQILAGLDKYDESRLVLEQIFNVSGQQQFLTDFSTTVRRMSPFFKYYARKLYTGEPSIPFAELIAKKYVILVNLDTVRVWSVIQQRLLGCVLVNEIVRAIHALRADTTGSGKPKPVWQGRCYLYIDEAGEFATRSLKRIMELKGKSGLWVRLAHQYDAQFRDREVAEAIHHLCKVQARFHTPGEDKKRIKDLYYGPLKDTIEDVLIPKQYCILKKDKADAVLFRVRDMETPFVSHEALKDFKQLIYKQPWYTAENKNARTRPTTPRVNNRQPDRGTSPDSGTPVPPEAERQERPRIKTVFTKADSPSPAGGVQPNETGLKEPAKNRRAPRKTAG